MIIRRNRGLRWFAGIVLVLVALVYLPTPLRKNFWYALDSIWVSPGMGYGVGNSVQANANSDVSIAAELGEEDLRRLMAKSAGLPVWRLEDLRVSVKDGQWSSNRNLPAKLAPVIDLYTSARFNGHTSRYARAVLEAMRSKPAPEMAFLSDIRMAESLPDGIIPQQYVSRVEKESFDGRERVKGFVVIDGELAWQHRIFYDESGASFHVWEERVDAMEFDRKLVPLFEEARQAAEERMKREGINGLGSCHSYWAFKKKYLRDKGYDWKSPSELNPHVMYD